MFCSSSNASTAENPVYDVRVTVCGDCTGWRSSTQKNLPASPRSSRMCLVVVNTGLSFYDKHPYPADSSKTVAGVELMYVSFLSVVALEMKVTTISALTIALEFTGGSDR